MNRMQLKAVLALLAVSATAFASSYPELGFKMLHNRDDPFRYYVDARSPRPGGIELSSVVEATQQAFLSWERVACAYPDFEYMGLTTNNPAINPNRVGDQFDAFNVSTVWITSESDEYYRLALSSGLSQTGSIPLTYSGYLYQCDIFINAVRYRWTTLPNTPPSDGLIDLQSALTHEIGHCMGLGDVFFPSTAAMNSDLPPGGNRRALDVHDQEHICAVYPENGAVGSPCSASDPCTNGLSCIPRPAADGGVQYRYCTRTCPNVSPGECPPPFVCRASPIRDGGTVCVAAPNEAITQVGKPCGADNECGSPVGICQPPTDLPSRGVAWEGGYCQQDCGPSGSRCPAGSACVDFTTNPSTPVKRCLKTCRTGGGDCRTGYTCVPRAEGNVCVPNCYTDQDCNSANSTAFVCRVCDRTCIANTGPGLSVGSPCNQTSQCGAGQVCLFVNNHPQGVCAEPCTSASCPCPAGTTCKPVGDKRLCMLDCSEGTCPQSLECNPLGTSFSCLPPCRNSQDCPSGLFCSGGRCTDPLAPPDAGCTLCGDGGRPPPPPPPVDGGVPGDDQPQGCGCSSSPASALFFFGMIALLLLAGGRRSWRRR
jgi:MYXO-CTERM domain-containing protein